jgi:hypothetical protein
MALERWRRAISRTTVYLEYGSGGSTIEALQGAMHVYSVESDKLFLDLVARQAGTAVAKGSFHPVHVDHGWTTKWGRPLFTWRTAERLDRWGKYTAAPWALIEQAGLVPDFIFVDGRFRVASVLESLLRLPQGADCLFMLDDFRQRSNAYSAVLRFATDVERCGRALVFRRRPDFNACECAKILLTYARDPD